MTYRELKEELCRLGEIDLNRQAVVWPPEGCPNASEVPIAELNVVLHKGNRANTVRLLTGKKPE